MDKIDKIGIYNKEFVVIIYKSEKNRKIVLTFGIYNAILIKRSPRESLCGECEMILEN